MLERTLRFVVLGGIFLLPFVVLIVASPFFFPFVTGKNFAFRIIVEIITGAWLALAIARPQYRPRFTWILVAVAFFVAALGISAVLGVNTDKSIWSNFERMEGWITLAHFLALFVVASSMFNTERMWRAFWVTSIFVSVFVAAVGLIQFIDAEGGARVSSTLGNPIYLAVYLLFHIFLTAMLAAQMWVESSYRKQTIAILASALIVFEAVVLFLTGTRGTMLGLIGGVLLTFLILLAFGRQSRVVWRTSAVVVGSLIVLIGAFFMVKDQDWVERVPPLQRLASISFDDQTTKARFLNWQMAVKGVQERPFFGWGQENYNYVFNKYYDPGLYNDEQWFDRVHNTPLDWAIAGGMVGLVAYASIFIAALWYIWFSGAFVISERSVLTGLLAAYSFHNLFVFDTVTSYILFAFVLAYIALKATEAGERSAVATSSRSMSNGALALVSVLSIAGVWGVASYVNAAAFASADSALQILNPANPPERVISVAKIAASRGFGEQEIREQVLQRAARLVDSADASDEDKERIVLFAQEEMDKQIAIDPDNARLHVLTGALLESAGKHEEAAPYLLRAAELSPTKQSILFQVGVNAWNLKEFNFAREKFCRAYELDTSFDGAKELCAAALIRAGDISEAEELVSYFTDRGVIPPAQIVAAYVAQREFKKVIEMWEARTVVEPEDLQARFSLAAAYYANGELGIAVAILEDVAAAVPALRGQVDQIVEQMRAGTLEF